MRMGGNGLGKGPVMQDLTTLEVALAERVRLSQGVGTLANRCSTHLAPRTPTLLLLADSAVGGRPGGVAGSQSALAGPAG
jgi:hypothetical protein